jgi:hypothetical protein
VLARQDYLRERGEQLVPEIEAELIKTFKEGGLVAQVSGREKTPYSIWRKMQNKNVSFEQLADIMAFRIIVADVAQCYQALGLIHGRYQVIPGRFKDYLSVPKPNGYRSLHTGVIGPLGQRIELQIRAELVFAESTSKCQGLDFGSRWWTGASSRITCALVPPKPKELTPARRGDPCDSHFVNLVLT